MTVPAFLCLVWLCCVDGVSVGQEVLASSMDDFIQDEYFDNLVETE